MWGRRPCQRAALGDEGGRAPAFRAAAVPFRFGPGQIVPPHIVGLAGHLGIDEAVDGFVGDALLAVLHGEVASHLLGRSAVFEPR